MSAVLERIADIGMLPVISIDKVERAVPLAQALSRGGLTLMEVMFRTDAAADSIAKIAAACPDFIIGAGTVLTTEQAKLAIASGARFLVSPSFNPQVVEFALNAGVPLVHGCVSPSEVDAACRMGLSVLKFFPAVENGGVKAMGLLNGPYPQVRFVPTGDLTLPLAIELLSYKKTAAAGGDFMLSYADIYVDDYAAIERSAAAALQTYFNFHVAHVGFNQSSKAAADNTAQRLSAVLGLSAQAFDKSTFAGTLFEVMHAPFHHAKGHVAIGTRDATRAYHFLKRRGVKFFEDTVTRDADGRVIAAYLQDDFDGFALHLLQD